MKYEINAFNTTFFKKLLWTYILLFIIIIVFYLRFKYNSIPNEEKLLTIEDLNSLLFSNSNYKNIFNHNALLIIYHIFIILYTSIRFINYETNNSKEFISLRQNNYILLFMKYIILLSFFIIFNFILYIFIYFLFKEYIAFKIIYFLRMTINTIYIITAIIVFYVIYNYLKSKNNLN